MRGETKGKVLKGQCWFGRVHARIVRGAVGASLVTAGRVGGKSGRKCDVGGDKE